MGDRYHFRCSKYVFVFGQWKNHGDGYSLPIKPLSGVRNRIGCYTNVFCPDSCYLPPMTQKFNLNETSHAPVLAHRMPLWLCFSNELDFNLNCSPHIQKKKKKKIHEISGMSADLPKQKQNKNQTTPPLPQEQSGYGFLTSIITSVHTKNVPQNLLNSQTLFLWCFQMVLAQDMKYLLTHQKIFSSKTNIFYFSIVKSKSTKDWFCRFGIIAMCSHRLTEQTRFKISHP